MPSHVGDLLFRYIGAAHAPQLIGSHTLIGGQIAQSIGFVGDMIQGMRQRHRSETSKIGEKWTRTEGDKEAENHKAE